jgi:hypothetical protein
MLWEGYRKNWDKPQRQVITIAKSSAAYMMLEMKMVSPIVTMP